MGAPARLYALLHRATMPFKAAVAAAASWWLAAELFGGQRPYFAPLAAILTMQVTVSQSVAFGAERILGVIGGVALSLAAVHWLRPGPVSVGMLVFLGMGIASALGFASRAVAQVGISGLLVMALGGRAEYAAARLLETVLGAIVGVAVQALVWPPDPTPLARAALGKLSQEIAGALDRLGRATPGDGRRLEHLTRQAEEARRQVVLARQSLEMSPLLRRRRREAQALETVIDTLERAAIEVRGMARSMRTSDLALSPWWPKERDALGEAARAVAAFGRQVEQPSPQGVATLGASLRAMQRRLSGALGGLQDPARAELRRDAGALLSDLERLRADLRSARRLLWPERD